ncbi:MAG: 4-hydroxy-tetrahydrodipicolinate reductase [Candidatus Margulisbacteria bacterium]|nr:4-hydroxy-tetrahydrodipicolinate reductase [Candidatus Margulisiibacteriota bacterium]
MVKIKVLVNGANGKMGSETVKAVLNAADLDLVGRADIHDDLAALIRETKAEVVVDFTHPASVIKNIKTILSNKAHAVIGTTGIAPKDLIEIKKLCQKNKVNCLIAPNFAIGAVLMMKFAEEAAQYLPKAEIIELHHDGKVDKPSGTALKTAEMMGGKIPIHSVRLPGLVAHQEVILGGVGQTLTIRHDSISRESFMPGVILAIRKAAGIKGLVLGLENLL